MHSSLITSNYPACTPTQLPLAYAFLATPHNLESRKRVACPMLGISHSMLIVPSAFAMGPVDPANLSHRSCFGVRHEPTDAADYTAIVAIRKDVWTFKKRDGLRLRALGVLNAKGNIPGYRQSPTGLCYVELKDLSTLTLRGGIERMEQAPLAYDNSGMRSRILRW
ncbi:hypothetical protein BJ912DRAFT_1048070 [Pholiota molesta]|nr:hypothetical protein BJ912DRAFT_1048070 [Pholiota molesta]